MSTQSSKAEKARRPHDAAFALLGILALYAVLVFPERPNLSWSAFARFPVELPVLIGVLIVARGCLNRAARWAVALFAVLVLLTKVSDLGMQMAAGRPFDAALDGRLLFSVVDIAVGTYGWPGAILRLLLSVAVLVAIGAILIRAPLWISASATRQPFMVMAAVAVLAFGAAAGLASGSGGITASATEAVTGQAARMVASARDLRSFRDELNRDPVSAIPSDALLARLRGFDVSIVFVESYGASLLTDPDYGSRMQAALTDFDNRLRRIGWEARSAHLLSTTVGGQSWLAHSSLFSGLRIDSQGRYEALTDSSRGTLIGDFGRAGWTTFAVMPAITAPWKEAEFYGYDVVLAAKDLGYRGKSFDWVTMPDQFTLASFERLRPSSPVMTEFALISSHLPWTPLPHIVPWEQIGSGEIFDSQVDAGEHPDSLWKDVPKLRQNYLSSILYVFDTLISYVEQVRARPQILIVLGDHEPIPMVAGEGASRAVPVHILASRPGLLDAIAAWQWTPGMRPAADAPLWEMGAFREIFVASFSRDVAPRTSTSAVTSE